MENIYSQGTAQWRKWLTFWVNKLKADGETFETDLTAVNLEITNLQNEKQDTLVSGQNIKTVNGNDITGPGDVVIASTGAAVVQNTGTSVTDVMSQNAVTNEFSKLYEDNNVELTIQNLHTIVEDKYVANTGVITSLAKTSYIVIPVTAGSIIYFNLLQSPYTNVNSHFGVFKNGNEELVSAITITGFSLDFSKYIRVPAGATKAYINFQKGYISRFKVYSALDGIDSKIKNTLLNGKNINDSLSYELFSNLQTFKFAGYFDVSGNIGNESLLLCQTKLYSVKQGEVYRIQNYSDQTTTPGSLSFKVAQFDSNLQFINRVNYSSDPYDYTVPTGVSYASFISLKSKTAELSIKRMQSASSVKILKSSIFPALVDAGNQWDGLGWASLGDSLTFQNLWQPYVISQLNLVHTNCGIGSTLLAGTDVNAFWQDVRLNAIKTANPSLVTILGGANDITQDIPIGTDTEFDLALGSKDKTNFKGAYSYIIENLLTWKPSLKIAILTTSFAHSGGGSYSPSGTMRYYMYANASREVAQHYGLPVVDLYREMNLNKLTQNIYTSDNIHWNNLGAKIVASLVISKLKEIKLI